MKHIYMENNPDPDGEIRSSPVEEESQFGGSLKARIQSLEDEVAMLKTRNTDTNKEAVAMARAFESKFISLNARIDLLERGTGVDAQIVGRDD